MNKVYLSGKISGLDEGYARAFFSNAKHSVFLSFINSGKYISYNDIINPFDIKPLFGIKCWIFYMAKDIFYLKKCTHIALMPNWKDSKGACIEHYIGKFIFKLIVIYL